MLRDRTKDVDGWRADTRIGQIFYNFDPHNLNVARSVHLQFSYKLSCLFPSHVSSRKLLSWCHIQERSGFQP